MDLLKRPLPQILPLDKDNPQNSTFTTPSGQVFSFSEMAEMLTGPHADPLDITAMKLGMTRTDIRTWNQQIQDVIGRRQQIKAEQEKKIAEHFKKTTDKLEVNKTILLTPNSASGSSTQTKRPSLIGLHSSIPDSGNIQGGSAAIVDRLNKILDVLQNQQKSQKDLLDLQKKKSINDEENRQEKERLDEEQGSVPNWFSKVFKGKGEGHGKLRELIDTGFETIFALLLNPEELIPAITALFGAVSMKNLFTKALSKSFVKLSIATAVALGYAIDDAVTEAVHAEDWKVDKISAALGGFFGGEGKGGTLWNAMAKAGEFAVTGMTIGSLFGPVGIVAGGIIGASVGAILGWMGPEKVAKWIDGGLNEMKRWADTLLGTHFMFDTKKAEESLKEFQDKTKKLQEEVLQSQNALTQVDEDIKQALVDKNKSLVASLTEKRDKLANDVQVKSKELEDAQNDVINAQRDASQAIENNFWTRLSKEFAWETEDTLKALYDARKNNQIWPSSNSARVGLEAQLLIAGERLLEVFGANLVEAAKQWVEVEKLTLKGQWIQLQAALEDQAKGISTLITGFLTNISDNIKGTLNYVFLTAQENVKEVKMDFDWLTGQVSGVYNTIVNATTGFFANTVANIQEKVANFKFDFSWVTQPLDDLMNSIKTWWANLFAGLQNAFQSWVDGTKNNILGLFGQGQPQQDSSSPPKAIVHGSTPQDPRTILLNRWMDDYTNFVQNSSAISDVQRPSLEMWIAATKKNITLSQNNRVAAGRMMSDLQLRQQSQPNVMAPLMNNVVDNRVVTSVNNTSVGGLPPTDNSFMGGRGW